MKKYRCVKIDLDASCSCRFTVGKIYNEELIDDKGKRCNRGWVDLYIKWLDKHCGCKFEEVKGEEMKLKEGMKLRCVGDGGFDMLWTVGKIYEVKKDKEGKLFFRSDSETKRYQGYVEENCGYAKFEEVKEMFGKKDLESGMVLVRRDGSKVLVINKVTIGKTWGTYNCVNEDLTHDLCKGLDVIEVYKPSDAYAIKLFIDNNYDLTEKAGSKWELIWQREDEEKAQALEELAKAEEALRKAREKVERMG